jgi:hypothetical protein
MSYDENRISDQIDGGLNEQKQLCNEAIQIHNETSLTPRQLLEQRDELAYVLESLNKEIDKYWNGDKSDDQVKEICKFQQQSEPLIQKIKTN